MNNCYVPLETDSELGRHQASITLTRQRESETSKQRVSATPDFPPIWYWQIAHQLSTTNFPATWPYYVVPRSPPPNQNSSNRSTGEKNAPTRGGGRVGEPPSGLARRDFSIRSRDSSFAEFPTFLTLLLFLFSFPPFVSRRSHQKIQFWIVSEFLFHQFNPIFDSSSSSFLKRI